MKPQKVPNPVFHCGKRNAQRHRTQCQFQASKNPGRDLLHQNAATIHLAYCKRSADEEQHQNRDKAEKDHAAQTAQGLPHQIHIIRL